MTPQEKLLEYMLFELTDEGGQPTLAPVSQNFGTEAISFTSPVTIFTWTNNSSFTSQVTTAQATGAFAVVSNTCGSVAGGASCQIGVTFTPTALGAGHGDAYRSLLGQYDHRRVERDRHARLFPLARFAGLWQSRCWQLRFADLLP